MQTDNRFIDDMARMMTGAMSAAGGMREEIEARMRHQLESMFARMELVRREEFKVVRDMAALARQENERLEKRLATLEARLAALEGKPKGAPRKRPAARKAAPKATGPAAGEP